jgi:hypothetical protein
MEQPSSPAHTTDEADLAGTVSTAQRLFVSYATPDKELANAVNDFLQLGCNLEDDQIFSTARPGTIEAGPPSLVNSAMAIRLLTPTSRLLSV